MKTGRRIKDYFLIKEQFNPSIAGLFLNPFYFARKAIYRSIRKYSGHVTGITLDIGCGSKPYEELFATEKYIGLDIDTSGHNHENSKIDVIYDGKIIPFGDMHFDTVVSFEVLELVFDPENFLDEAGRVLKNGGKAIFTVPFIWDEMEPPYDYARYTSFGLKHLFEKHGFTVLEHEKYLCDLRLLALLLNAYIYKVIRRLIPSKASMLLILPLTSVINIVSHIFWLFPDNKDLYFGNIFLLKKEQTGR